MQSRPLYSELLARFLGFYEPLEEQLQALDGWSEAGIDLASRRKTPWLAHDLGALGISPVETTAIARCDRLPRIDTLARGFGCAYVLEGATLGGRHITQMLAGTDIPERARTFFRSYGAAVGEQWKEFTSALEIFAEKGDETEIVEAACATFASLQTWLGGAR